MYKLHAFLCHAVEKISEEAMNKTYKATLRAMTIAKTITVSETLAIVSAGVTLLDLQISICIDLTKFKETLAAGKV